MNMLLVYRSLGLEHDNTQVVLFDKFQDGPYHELIQAAFSAKHPVLRHSHYQGKVRADAVCSIKFKHVMYVLISSMREPYQYTAETCIAT